MTEEKFHTVNHQRPCDKCCMVCRHFLGGYDEEGKCRHPDREDDGQRYNTVSYNTCDAFDKRK